MIKLIEKEELKGIWVGDMKDGDVGVIVAWTYGLNLGRIVQRYKDSLITIGLSSGSGWTDFFNVCDLPNDCRVRLLEKGDTLIVI